MAANMHVFDRRLRSSQERLDAEIEEKLRWPGCFPNRAFVVDERWPMYTIVRRVLDNSDHQVGVLRIHCHGNASWMQLGTGVSNADDTASFHHLQGCWVGQFPRIELHACAVASATSVSCPPSIMAPEDYERRIQAMLASCVRGTETDNSPGAVMLQAMADNAGIPVVASLDVQYGPGYDMEGEIRRFFPATYHRRDGTSPV